MRKVLFCAALVSLALYAGIVSAQVCNSSIASTISSATTVSGNSCQASSSLANFCQNADPMNGAGVAIYALTVGAANTGVTISVTSTGTPSFLPYLALQKPDAVNGCDSVDQCVFDNQSATTSESGTLPNGSPAGTYYIVVGDTAGDSPGCGAFNLTVAGTLPVKLQKFSVK